MPENNFTDNVVSAEESKGIEVFRNNEGKSELSLESLALLVNTERLTYLRNNINTELKELRQRQENVRLLHKIQKKVNTGTTKAGEFDCSKDEELKKLLVEAKNLGVEIKDGHYKFTKEERDRLMDNIQVTVEDFNVSNEMQVQTITRLTHERYESYQMARSIVKPLHEAKTHSARAIHR